MAMRDDQIKNAIAFAKIGFYIFPAFWKPDTKQHIGLVQWREQSTRNADTIRAWGQIHPHSAYFCVDLRKSKLFVADVDCKDQKQGLANLEALRLTEEWPDTYIVETPSGGQHHIMHGDIDGYIGVNRIAEGIDVPPMIPLPNSIIFKKGVYRPLNQNKILPIPDWFNKFRSKPKTLYENRDEALIALDQRHNIYKAIQLAGEVEPAIEGQGGNDHTYRVAVQIRQLGVSAATCFSVLVQHFNPRCLPHWQPHELKRIIQNAYNYAKSPPGADAPELDFTPVIPDNLVQFAHFQDLTAELPIPHWLIKEYIEKNTVTLFFGDSSTYKSFLALDIGLHIASGQQWLDKKTAQGSVVYLAGEGHGGVRRRLRAWKDRKLKNKDKHVPFYVSPQAIQLDHKGNTKLLIDSIKAVDPNPELVIIDTLATAFGEGDENSTKDMNKFLNHVFEIRDALNTTILIIHHTGHSAKERPRGAYTLMGNVDAHYKVEKHKDQKLMCLRWPRKMKDGEPPADTWFQIEVIKIGVDEDLDNITSLVLHHRPEYTEEDTSGWKLSPSQKIIYNLIRANPGIAVDSARNRYKEVLGLDYRRQTWRKGLIKLKDLNVVNERDGLLTAADPVVDPELTEGVEDA